MPTGLILFFNAISVLLGADATGPCARLHWYFEVRSRAFHSQIRFEATEGPLKVW